MSSKERSGRPQLFFHDNQYTGSLPTTGSELQLPTTLPRSLSAQKPSVLQPEPAVGDEPLSGYRLFDIRPLVKFVEQFHSGYDVPEFGAGLATTVLFYMHGMWCYHELEKTLMVKTLTCISSVALTKTVYVS